ncbi:MAG: DUF1385 domain-containing protein [Clostridiales bacterium]|jgi:uncharacterized protein YqhQ|nr:DUF1385 domain-containing protein [Clostridiales bacterium]
MGNIKDALSNKGVKPTLIGGQAVMEGVMMRGRKMYAMAVRLPDQTVQVVKKDLFPITDRYPILKWPVLRGIVAFIDSMVTGMRIITQSAEMITEGIPEEEEPSKWEKYLTKKFGDKLNEYILYISVGVALIFAIFLFMLLPVWIGHFFNPILQNNTWALGIIEGLIRILIFLIYVYLISLSKEIKRVYQYHGAEHKTINCFEHQEELCVENVKKHSRLHKRCGTSFLLIVMLMAMIVFIFVQTDVIWMRFISRIILVPVIAGLSYEVIKWAGRNDNTFVNAISFPGLCLQKITTAEPDDGMMETAIAAMKGVLESEPEQSGCQNNCSDNCSDNRLDSHQDSCPA